MSATPSLHSDTAKKGNIVFRLALCCAILLILTGTSTAWAQNPGQLQFTAGSYSVVESEGFATLSVSRLGGTDGVITVGYSTTNGTAVAGQDYLAKNGTLTFADGQTNKNITILLFDNTITNTTRTIDLVLFSPTGGAVLGVLDETTLFVTDNDADSDSIEFSMDSFAVNENGGSAIIFVTREGARTQTVSVDYRTVEGGTASEGSDFTGVSGTLFFNAGQATASFAIPILDDVVVGEGDETVFLELTNPAPTNQVTLGNSSAILRIQENDFSQSTFIFSQATYLTGEGDTAAEITVTRAGDNAGIASVEYFTSDGSAVAFADYFPVNDSLVFTNGQRFASFFVPIVDDFTLDDGETIQLTLTNATGGATIGRADATLTIADNDAAYRFSADRYVVEEDATNVVVTVLREGGTNGTATVRLLTSDGVGTDPALSAFDYESSFPTLIFTNGQTFVTFAVPIIDDVTVEPDETFNVTLEDPSSGQLNSPFTAEVVVLDNDTDAGTFAFSFLFETNDLREGIFNSITLSVVRQGGTTGDVTVDYFPTFNPNLFCPGSVLAEDGFDFDGGFGTLQWDDGEGGRKTFRINVIDDADVELDEVISVRLFNATGGAAISSVAGETTATIIFQDPPPGAVDQFYNFRSDLNPNPGANNTVSAVAIYPPGGGFFFSQEGKAIIAGEFTAYNATVRNRIARVNVDGSVDLTFDPAAGANGFISAVAIQPDDRVLVGGGFTSFDNINRHGIARLNDDGSLDTTFNPGTGVDGVILAMELLPDGRILIGGLFSQVNGAPHNNIALLNPDGSVASGFQAGQGPNDAVLAIASQPDGGVVIGGDFTSVNGVPRNRIARLDSVGAVDTFFNPVSGADNAVRAVEVQTDGRILIGGTFTTVNGLPWSGLARLNADGSSDTAGFNPGAGISGGVNSIALQSDGRPLVAGAFFAFDGIARTNVLRLNLDGTLDTGFLDNYYNQRQPGPNGFVNSVVAFPRIVGQTFFTNMIGTNVFIFTNSVAVDEVYIGGSFDRIGGGNLADDVLEKLNFARLIGGDIQPFNNKPGNLSFVSPTVSVDENVLGGFVSVSLQRLNGVLGRVRVSYETYDISAKAGIDYQPVSGTFFWDDCDGFTKAFNVPIFDNGEVEGNRAFGVRIFNPIGTGINATNLPALGFQTTSEVLIVDDDFERGALQFLDTVYYAGEESGSALVTVIRTNGTSGSATVQYTTENGSAIAPGDYTARSGVLFFGPGQNTRTFSIPIVNDTAKEFEEFVGLRLFNASGGVDLPDEGARATLAILDNDNGVGSVSFSLGNFVVGESEGIAEVTVQRTSGAFGPLDVDYRIESGIGIPGQLPAIDGADFIGALGRLSFAGGEQSKTFNVPLISDRLVEGPEVIKLTLTNASAVASIGFRTNALITILDDDFYGDLGFAADEFFVNEVSGVATITVVRVGGSTDEVAVDFSAALGTAEEGVDYVATNGSLVFGDGVISQTFQVAIIDDLDLEANETIQLSLGNFSKAPPGEFISAVLRINDDEALSVPAGSIDTLFAPNPGPNDIVNVVAMDDDDRMVIAGEFTAVNGISRGRIARLQDNGSVDGSFNPGLGANDTVHGVWLQDDGKIVMVGRFTSVGSRNWSGVGRLSADGRVDSFFDPGAGVDNPVFAVAGQTDGRILIGGEFSNFDSTARNRLARLMPNGALDESYDPGAGPDGTVYVIVLQEDGRALLGGDFTTFSGVDRSYLVRLNVDGSVDESFNVGNGIGGSVRSITLQDDGRIIIGGFFTVIDGEVRDHVARLNADGTVDETFSSTGGADGFVLATALQADGRVLIGGNFTSVAGVPNHRVARLNADGSLDGTINFGSGANDFVATLAVQDDEKIVLGGGFTEFNDTTRNYLARVVGGEESGPGVFGLSRPLYGSVEGTNATITVVRTGGAEGTVTVDLTTTDGSATAGEDYQAIDTTLTFEDGVTVVSIELVILDDSAVEDLEDLVVTLSNPVNGALLGAQALGVVEIESDDSELAFAEAVYSVNESAVGGVANISVSRTGATDGTVSVQYSTESGSATNGVDFADSTGLLIFGPGVTARIFTVPIFDDLEVEGGESFSVSLTNVIGDANLGLRNAVVNIVDNDFSPGTMSFSSSLYVVREGDPFAQITVLRTNGSTGVIGLDYSTAPVVGGGAATPGADYFPAAGRITFGDGATSQTFFVPLAGDDTLVEGNEIFTVTISNPSDGTISGAASATVRIEDNEFGPGTLDPSFDPGAGADNVVRSVAIQADGKVLVGGAFSFLDNHPRNFVGRLHSNGLIDTNFMNSLATNCVVTNFTVTNLVFTNFYQIVTNIIDVVETNCVPIGANALVASIAPTVNERIVFGGAFSQVNGTNRNRVTRLLDDGNLDTSFDQPNGVNSAVNAVVPLPDGKVYLGGAFSQPARGITRLKANGTVDVSFDPGVGPNGPVNAIYVMENQQLLIGGNFNTVNGVPRTRFARLNADGTVDIRFNPTVISNGVVYAVEMIEEGPEAGKIMLAGSFFIEGDTNRHSVMRLTSSGERDESFDPEEGPNAVVYCLSVSRDGTVVVGGDFTMVNGIARNRIARLNADGSVDESWDPGSGANNTVFSMAKTGDGGLVIGGAFSVVNGFERRGIARINGGEVSLIEIEPPSAPTGGQFVLTFSSLPGRTYAIDASEDLVRWAQIGVVDAIGTTSSFTDPAAGAIPMQFYRVREVTP